MTRIDRFFRFLNKPHDGRSVLAVLAVVCFVSAFAFWIWPTPYLEWTTQGGKHGKGPTVYHRIDRFTGAREHGFPGFFGSVHWEPG